MNVSFVTTPVHLSKTNIIDGHYSLDKSSYFILSWLLKVLLTFMLREVTYFECCNMFVIRCKILYDEVYWGFKSWQNVIIKLLLIQYPHNFETLNLRDGLIVCFCFSGGILNELIIWFCVKEFAAPVIDLQLSISSQLYIYKSEKFN